MPKCFICKIRIWCLWPWWLYFPTYFQLLSPWLLLRIIRFMQVKILKGCNCILAVTVKNDCLLYKMTAYKVHYQTYCLLKKWLSLWQQSLMTGLMFHRPTDHIQYLLDCLEKVKNNGQVTWNMFVEYKRSKTPLPPITPENGKRPGSRGRRSTTPKSKISCSCLCPKH